MNTPIANISFPTDYRLGCGRRAELPRVCAELGIHRPLVVTDSGLARLPWFAALSADLAGYFDHPLAVQAVAANPGASDVDRGVETFRREGCDGLLLVGGGSAMDAGKCIGLMVDHAGSVFDYEDVGDNWKRIDGNRLPPAVALPTTAGTGSEVGRAGVLVDDVHHRKVIIFHPRMLPRVVLADPELTFDLPRHLTAATGLDAWTHCFEAFCAVGFHPPADGIALAGMGLIHASLRTAYEHGRDALARTHMLMASAMGAMSFQKGLGLVHAMSHALGGVFPLHHGLTNAVLLPYCMAFNRPVLHERMELLARTLALPNPGFAAMLRWTLEIRKSLAIPERLADCEALAGQDFAAHLPELVQAALRDPSLTGNPRPANADEIAEVFQSAYRGALDA